MNQKFRHVHFVGIGGIGMCGIAELLHGQGHRVTGSDLRDGQTLDRLRMLGVDVYVGHDAIHVGDAQVVVRSAAIRPDNPELEMARRRKIPVIERAEMLAEIMRVKDGIAVAGSHGKTTTSSLIAHLLDAAGLDPTAVIGGRVTGLGGDARTARMGGSDWMVVEADESDGSFLRLKPVIAVVTNIDPEHLDHYGDVAALKRAFVRFANDIPFWGTNVLCIDHPGVQAILPEITRRFTTYGFSSQADWSASGVEAEGFAMRFDVAHDGNALGRVTVPLPGRHNVANALAALAVADELEIDFETAAAAVASFGGVQRRFEQKGVRAGVRVVDDYAHHPAEVRATLEAARKLHPGRIVAVFQPHRYTRTRDCFEGFATAFNDSDLLVVSEIYAAGDDPIADITGQKLADAVAAHGHRSVRFVATLDAIAEQLPKELQEGDLVLTLGAGDVTTLGPRLLDALEGGPRR